MNVKDLNVLWNIYGIWNRRANMTSEVINKIQEEKIITILRGVPSDKLIPLAEAMYEGGIRLIECTYDASGKVKDEEIAQNIKTLSEHFEGRMFVGAGTVLTKKQVILTKKAGGKFIISPDTNSAVIKKTKKEGLVSIPGAFTPTEICVAKRAGADFVKIFPVGAIGSKYVRDVLAPLSNCKLLAVGGINENNMNEYFDAGVLGIGIGSGIVDKKAIENNDFDTITKHAKLYTDSLR